MPSVSEAWTFWPCKEAAGVADAMIKACMILLDNSETENTSERGYVYYISVSLPGSREQNRPYHIYLWLLNEAQGPPL